MARKRNRTRYTAEQKYKYHVERMQNDSVSENKRAYSKFWVEGFLDPYAARNIGALESEFKRDKKYYDMSGRVRFQGQINGTKAAARNPEIAFKYNHRD